MWLLLVAAGTGYLARCWRRARRLKFDSCSVQHHAAFCLSDRSPSCTPRRGRPVFSSRRRFPGRPQSAKGANRKVCRRTREGQSLRSSLCDGDVVDSVDNHLGEGKPVGETISRVQNPKIVREDMEAHVPVHLLPPVFPMGFLNNKLEPITLASENWSDWLDLTDKAWLPSPCKKELLHLISFTPSASSFKLPKIVTKEKDEKQGFSWTLRESSGRIFQSFAKIARNLGQKASILSCKQLEKGIQLVEMHREKLCPGPHAFSSNLLNAILDPEYYIQNRRTKISHSVRKRHGDSKPPMHYLCPSHQAAQILAQNVPVMSSSWVPSDRETHGPCASTGSSSLGRSEVFSVALGMALGLVMVASTHKIEVAELHKLLEDTNSVIHQLKRQMDSVLLQDPHGAASNGELLRTNAVYEACLLKISSEPDANSCGDSAADSSLLELFRADDGSAPSILPVNQTCGLSELEAELEAELQLMEENIGNSDVCSWEMKHINFNEKNGVHQVDGELYVDRKDFGFDTFDLVPVQVVDQFCESDYAVPPLELERRLWQVLEQRQEERILELEKGLHLTQKTVAAQAEEIQWWKDRVWWLMETSLGGKLGSSDSIDSALS